MAYRLKYLNLISLRREKNKLGKQASKQRLKNPFVQNRNSSSGLGMRLTCKVFNFVHWIFHSKYFVLQFVPSFSIQSLDWRSLTSGEFERRLRSKYLVRSWSLCRCMSTTTTAEPRGSLTPMNIDVLLFMLICSGVLSRHKVLWTNNYWRWTTSILLSPRKFILTWQGLSINDVTQILRQFK